MDNVVHLTIKAIQMSNLCKRARRMRAGVSLFKVYNLSDYVYIQEAVVAARPRYIKIQDITSHMIFVDVKTLGRWSDKFYKDTYADACWSLADMNVQGGGYNQHRVFFKRTAAQRYMNLLIAMSAKHRDY